VSAYKPLELLPLPEEFEYISATEKVQKAWENAPVGTPPREVLEHEMGHYASGQVDSFLDRADAIGRLVDPHIRTERGTPFALGALTGVAVARYVHQEQVPFHALGVRRLEVVTSESYDAKNLVTVSNEVAKEDEMTKKRLGTQALATLELIGQEAIVEDTHHARLVFMRGCRFILGEAYEYHLREKTSGIQAVIDGIENNNPQHNWSIAAILELFDKK